MHNADEFLAFDFAIGSSLLTLFWNYYFDEKNVLPFQLRFENTRYLNVFPRDAKKPSDEDDRLELIIFNDKFELHSIGGIKMFILAENVQIVMSFE